MTQENENIDDLIVSAMKVGLGTAIKMIDAAIASGGAKNMAGNEALTLLRSSMQESLK